MPDPQQPPWLGEFRKRAEELVDEYRRALHDALNDLTEDEARRRLVPSQTTLLGLVKHATFVEGVWFDQAITGRTYAEIGIPRQSTPRSRWVPTTRSGRSKRPIAIGGTRRAGTSPPSISTRSSPGEEPVPSGRCSSKSCASSLSTQVTPTSSESRS